MKKGYDFVRIVGIIIIILVLGFFGGYGIMQSQIDDQKEFKGVKNVIPMSRSSLLADTKRPLPNGTKQLEALASYNNSSRC